MGSETARPVVLVILDGWGVEASGPGNAVTIANTPTLDTLGATCPHTRLRCSGEDVGLPPGQMGNSEVGHLNIGAGRIVYQWITRLDHSIADGSFFENPTLILACASARQRAGTLHLMGLVSEGGVHSHTRHLVALLELASRAGVRDVAVHAFTDGRDTPPESGCRSMLGLERAIGRIGVGRIASVSGRYYAMDRDHRWERTEAAFRAIALGEGARSSSAVQAIQDSYAACVTDEFIVPVTIPDGAGTTTTFDPADSIICFNFRSDRGRQLTEALAAPAFAHFDRGPYQAPASITTLTTYDPTLSVHVAFAPHDVTNPLARVISDAGRKQFHTAETEKYAHVTFFINGGRETPFPGEDRALVPSPKVATYDLQPEMSAEPVADGVNQAIESGRYDFVIVNFANCDMVGHTGVLDAAVKAVETVDRCVRRILDVLLPRGGVAIITADHGNAERMLAAGGGPFTSHTTNEVPVILVSPPGSPLTTIRLRQGAVLSSIAPTVLELIGLPAPTDMDQPSLIIAE